MSLSPHTAPALRDDDVAPARELSHRESHSGGGETPLERLAWSISSEQTNLKINKIFMFFSLNL